MSYAGLSGATGVDKREQRRQEMIYELVQTEKGYLRHLEIMRQVFRRPLAEECGMELTVAVFGNLDQLLAAARPVAAAFAAVLPPASNPVVSRIGPVAAAALASIDPQVYAAYCARQKAAHALYMERMRSAPAAAACIRRCEQSSVAGKLALGDFLAKPLQRLTKYPLLLRGIAQYTAPEDTDEVADLNRAAQQADSVLGYVQEAVREAEDRSRLRDLWRRLDPTGLDEAQLELVRDLDIGGRRLLHEGPVKVC
jgi:Rho guanine nucleotide exchange factor 12